MVDHTRLTVRTRRLAVHPGTGRTAWCTDQALVPTFRSSCSIAAPTFTNFGKSWALANLLILVPLYRSEVPDRIRRLWSRDFRSAVLAHGRLCVTSGSAGAKCPPAFGGCRRRRPGRNDQSASAIKRAGLEFETEQAGALEWTRQGEAGGQLHRKAKPAVIGLVAEQDHRAMATRACRRKRTGHQRGASAEPARGAVHRKRAKHERSRAPGADVP